MDYSTREINENDTKAAVEEERQALCKQPSRPLPINTS